MKRNTAEKVPSRPAKYWEQPELQQAQEAAMREAARQAAVEHDRRNKPTKAQRVGRVALGGIANTVLVAHNTKVLTKGAGALLGKDTHASIARKGEAIAPRLRQKHEARQSTEVAPSRMRRLGNLALRASVVATEAITRRSSKRAVHLDEKSARLEQDFTQKRGGGRLVNAARAYKEGRAEEKRQAQIARRKAADEGVIQYREAHPEIAERERQEREASARHDTLINLWQKREWIVDYFQDKRSVYSFAKAIPRRPSREGQPGFTGDYTELAKSTLASAMTYKAEDGTVPLLGSKLERARLIEDEKQGQSIYQARKTETQYTDGVSTALWQLGFVQFEKESDIPYSRGVYNPEIEWEQTKDSVKARIPFDANNELHQMLAPEATGMGQMIELEMSQKQYGYSQQSPYMNMRMVEAAIPTPVAA